MRAVSREEASQNIKLTKFGAYLLRLFDLLGYRWAASGKSRTQNLSTPQGWSKLIN